MLARMERSHHQPLMFRHAHADGDDVHGGMARERIGIVKRQRRAEMGGAFLRAFHAAGADRREGEIGRGGDGGICACPPQLPLTLAPITPTPKIFFVIVINVPVAGAARNCGYRG